MPNYVKLEDLETFDTDYGEGTRDDEHSGAKSNLGRDRACSVAACLSKAIYVRQLLPQAAAAAAAAASGRDIGESHLGRQGRGSI